MGETGTPGENLCRLGENMQTLVLNADRERGADHSWSYIDFLKCDARSGTYSVYVNSFTDIFTEQNEKVKMG